MEMYFLKSAACLAILLLFYKLLLEKEKMHRFKRVYLLSSVIISIIIPWITFTTYIEVPTANSTLLFETSTLSNIEEAGHETNYLQLILWSIYGLGVIFFSFAFFKNLRELILKINRNPKLKKDHVTNVLLQEEVAPHTFWNYIFLNKYKYETHSIPQEVFQHEEAHATQKHTFDILFMELLHIIFWFNPLIYMTKNAIKLNHEFLADEAVLEKGANTKIYQETLLSFSSNQLNSSLSNSINYSSTRLTVFGKTFSFGKFGQVKKRFTVMKTKTSKKAILVRTFLLLPLLSMLLYSFSTEEVVMKEVPVYQIKTEEKQEKPNEGIMLPTGETIIISEDINLQIFKNQNLLLNNLPVSLENLSERLKKLNDHLSRETRKKVLSVDIVPETNIPMGIITDVKRVLRVYGVSDIQIHKESQNALKKDTQSSIAEELEEIEEMGLEIQYTDPSKNQKKATPKMIAEYNKMARGYNMQTGQALIETEKFNEMQNIYKLMTAKQKRDAEPFPEVITIKVVEDGPVQEKATPEMIAEYNRLAKFYAKGVTREMIEEKGYPEIEKEFNRLRYIYSLMTEKQREAAEKMPPPPPPPSPPAPMVPDAKEMSPPPPPSPEEAIEKWTAEGAEFFFNEEKITSKEALELVQKKNGKNLSVHVEENNSEKTVFLSIRRSYSQL